MSTQIASIVGLAVMFIIATLLPINMGALALVGAFVIGLLSHMPAREIFAGFPGDLFVTLVGITYLFAIAHNNGTIVIRLVWISVEYTYLRRFRIKPVKSFSNWFSLGLSSIPFFVGAFYRMRIEDQTLQEVLGLEFVEYSTATKLLIPKIY